MRSALALRTYSRRQAAAAAPLTKWSAARHRLATTTAARTSKQSSSRSLYATAAACAAVAVALATALLPSSAHAEEAITENGRPPVDRSRAHTVTPQHTRSAPLENARIAELRAFLSDPQCKLTASLTAEQRAYVSSWALNDDWMLLRYLRGNSMSVAKAAPAVIATAQWRLENKVDDLTVQALGGTAKDGRMYVSSSCDPNGRSLIVYKKSGEAQKADNWNSDVYTREMHALVYTLERAVRCMEDRATSGMMGPHPEDHMDYKWSMLIDLGSYTQTSATPWHVTRRLIDVLRFHYPERLHRVILVEPPAFLKALFVPLRLVLPSVTVSKVVFLYDRHSDATLQLLTEVFGSLDRLPAEMDLVGARTLFDGAEYVRTDPLGPGKKRPTSVEELQTRLQQKQTLVPPQQPQSLQSQLQPQQQPQQQQQADATTPGASAVSTPAAPPKRSWW